MLKFTPKTNIFYKTLLSGHTRVPSGIVYMIYIMINPLICKESVLLSKHLSRHSMQETIQIPAVWLSWLSPRLRDAWGSSHHWSGNFFYSIVKVWVKIIRSSDFLSICL